MAKGISHIIVGATGTGKTTFVKSLLSSVRNQDSIIVYDVNKEYADFYPYPFINFEAFTAKVTGVKNAVLVFEESTIFLNNRSCNRDLNEILVRKRHNQNYIILIFHSLRSIPRYTYELSNFITVFKTNDSPDLTARELKDERIEQIMNDVKDSPDRYFNKTLKIY